MGGVFWPQKLPLNPCHRRVPLVEMKLEQWLIYLKKTNWHGKSPNMNVHSTPNLFEFSFFPQARDSKNSVLPSLNLLRIPSAGEKTMAWTRGKAPAASSMSSSCVGSTNIVVTKNACANFVTWFIFLKFVSNGNEHILEPCWNHPKVNGIYPQEWVQNTPICWRCAPDTIAIIPQDLLKHSLLCYQAQKIITRIARCIALYFRFVPPLSRLHLGGWLSKSMHSKPCITQPSHM